MSELTKEKLKETRYCKPVIQYNKDGSFIKEHRSIEDAVKYVKASVVKVL